MDIFLNALSAVSLLMLLMGTGYFMGWKGWMGAQEKAFLGKFILNFAVPSTCIVGLVSNIHLTDLRTSTVQLIAGACSVASVLLLAAVLGHILPLPHSRRGVFSAMAGLSNTLFIGIPVATQIFGDEAVQHLMLYYVSNTICLQIIGMAMIRASGDQMSEGESIPKMALDIVKKPPVLAIIASILIILLELPIPTLVWKYMDYVGGTVSPLALIYCGFILYEIGFKNLRLMEWHWLMLLVRLVVAPAITYGIATVFGLDGMARGVFTLVAGLPVVSQVPVFAGTFGADEQYAASGACISTILCCITVPVMMVLMG